MPFVVSSPQTIVDIVLDHPINHDGRKVFPNLIIVHADGLETMNGGVGGISFNFNKFRSMMLRIKVAVQLDADMVVGAHCDRLFDSTAAEITAEYPCVYNRFFTTRRKCTCNNSTFLS